MTKYVANAKWVASAVEPVWRLGKKCEASSAMWSFVGSSFNLPFAVALGVLLGLSALELLSTLLGAALSGVVDQLLPDFDLDADVDLGVEPGIDGAPAVEAGTALQATEQASLGHVGVGGQVLDWLHLGRVPTLMLLLIFLASFGVSGLVVQHLAQTFLGTPWPAWLASIPALLSSLPAMHWIGGALARIIPREETSAVSRSSFVGKFATVIGGTARKGNPAQAKLRDEYGQVHYVLVEPEDADAAFPVQSQVILIAVQGAVFQAVASDLPRLPDDGSVSELG